MLRSRPYRGADDLATMQDLVSNAAAVAGYCGHMHRGDVPHRLYNGLRGRHLDEVVRLWEDDGGIAGFCFFSDRRAWLNVEIRPDIEASGIEVEMLAWAEEAMARRHEGTWPLRIETDCFTCDGVRAMVLTQAGWSYAGDPYVLTTRPLAEVPDVILPDGYSIRPVEGLHEADAVGDVHAAGFGSTWPPGAYRKVMESPGYDAERELVAVAPGGEFAGFCILWFDDLNRTGLFEPVATHPDHRRRGIGRALLAAGMARMKERGLDTAMVVYEGANAGSGALYHAAGFADTFEIVGYDKRLEIGADQSR